jgi:hypothetical protein
MARNNEPALGRKTPLLMNLNLISKFEIEHMLGTSRYRVNQKGRAKVRLPMRIEADESLGRLGGFSELNRVHRFTVAVF